MQIDKLSSHLSASADCDDPLALIAEYKHPQLLQRFVKEFGILEDRAAELFEDTKKWLYLVSKHQELPMPIQIAMVDEMWHTFLLFTADYRDFCANYLGSFIDHVPEDPTQMQERTNYDMRGFIELVYDELGENTAVRWFKDIPIGYPPVTIDQLKLAVLKDKFPNESAKAVL